MAFWEDPDVVARFAERDPDHRLLDLLETAEKPDRLRVLDLGCAAGRNTVLLAERGCDVFALDRSSAMVEETQRRVAQVLGAEQARRRVLLGSMDDLSGFGDRSFDLVVALGVLHQAENLDEWHRTVEEIARVLRSRGQLLSAHFAPGTDFTGEHGQPVAGEAHVYEHLPGERGVFLAAERSDALVGEHGFQPVVPTEEVVVPRKEGGRRITINARYRLER